MENVGNAMGEVMRRQQWNDRFQAIKQEILQHPEVAQFLNEHQEQLTDEMIDRSISNLNEFIQEQAKFRVSDPTQIAPGYEPKLVLQSYGIDVTYVPTEALIEAQEAEKVKKRVTTIDMPRDIRHASFDQFEVTNERMLALDESLKFIESYTQAGKQFVPGLYFQGSFGVGKTYLLGAIANELAERGYQTTLVHFPTFAVEMKNAIGTNTTGEKLDAVKKTPVLMIDDIGADSMSSWIRDDVLGVILQYRMQEQLPTFFSSNFSMKQLENEHLRITQRGEDEPLKAKRIMERVRFLSKEIKMVGKNRRLS